VTPPRVLAVDDEQAVLDGIAASLRRRVELVGATDPNRALELLENDGPFAVIVSDYQMRGMNGAAFLKRARAVAPHAMRLMLTGRANFDALVQVVNDGFLYRLLIKPCPTATLVQAIADAIEEHRAQASARAFAHVAAERSAQLAATASSIGHEMNNAMMLMIGYLEEQKFAGASDPALAELELVADHMRMYASHLLELGRPQVERLELLDLRSIVEHVAHVLRMIGRLKHVPIEIDCGPLPVWLRVDRRRIEQVLTNLLMNAGDAIQAARRPGRVVVRTGADAASGRAWCRVEDDGCGVLPELRKAIFEPHFTTKAPGRGNGLGLAVVRYILDGYRGEVSVESEPGVRTTFQFTLPLADEQPQHATPPQTSSGPSDRRSWRG
jgi:signal transduction histidine kinase